MIFALIMTVRWSNCQWPDNLVDHMTGDFRRPDSNLLLVSHSSPLPLHLVPLTTPDESPASPEQLIPHPPTLKISNQIFKNENISQNVLFMNK